MGNQTDQSNTCYTATSLDTVNLIGWFHFCSTYMGQATQSTVRLALNYIRPSYTLAKCEGMNTDCVSSTAVLDKACAVLSSWATSCTDPDLYGMAELCVGAEE